MFTPRLRFESTTSSTPGCSTPIHTPYQEYLVKWNAVHQHWFEQPLEPQEGMIRLPDFPGLCPALDESRVEASAEL